MLFVNSKRGQSSLFLILFTSDLLARWRHKNSSVALRRCTANETIDKVRKPLPASTLFLF